MSKKIIIDSVDVSECFYFIDHTPPKGQGDWCGAIHKGACKVYSKDCEHNKDCYFKQLKRLQEENKKLRQVRKNSPDIQEPYIYLYRQIKKQCHKLEEENEELKKFKKEISKPIVLPNIEEEVINKYKQALEEIKKILLDYCSDCVESCSDCLIDKSLFKINEVLK